jgi:hypothetical protein
MAAKLNGEINCPPAMRRLRSAASVPGDSEALQRLAFAREQGYPQQSIEASPGYPLLCRGKGREIVGFKGGSRGKFSSVHVFVVFSWRENIPNFFLFVCSSQM